MTINKTSFYFDTAVPQWHFDQLLDYNIDQSCCFNSIDDFLASNSTHKISSFHVPFPPETTWIDRVNQVYDTSDSIIIFCSELHEHTVEQICLLDRPKITFFICGFLNQPLKHSVVYQWMDFLSITSHFYQQLMPNLLKEKLISNHHAKSKKFDVLLGCSRVHRDFVYNYINEYQLNDQVTMTYFRTLEYAIQDKDFILEKEGLEFIPDRQLKWTIDNVMYYGYEKSLSQIVPISIYNDTYYTLVTETNYFNHFNFYTEKIVKPILAGRLFIAIAGQHFLANLRSLGFKTFDNVIDETYDQEPNHTRRWNMAMQQFELLCLADPVEIYEQIQTTVEHNKNLMMTFDWYAMMQSNFKNTIGDFLID
jgi:hypothetical protein